MGVFSSPVDLMKHQTARFAKVKITMMSAHKMMAEGGRDDYKEQTTGRLSEKQLRLIGHPYSRRARVLQIAKLSGYRGLQDGNKAQISARGRVADLPINIQSGRLHATVTLLSKNGGKVYDLFSPVPYASFVLAIDGTKYMRPRGLLGPTGLIRKRFKARQNALVEAVRQQQRKP